MQRLKLLIPAVLTVFALGATMSATAFAGVEVLVNNAPSAVKFSGKSAKATALGVLGSKRLIRCGEIDTEGELEASGKLGPFHFDCLKARVWEGTTNLGPCKGLGEPAETILFLGTIHLATNSTLTVGYVLLLVEHFHYECTVLFITKLVLGLGELLCQITPINVLTTTATIRCEHGAEDGDPSVASYENDKGEAATLTNPLKSGEAEAAEEMAAEEGESEITLTPAAKIDV